MKLFAQHPKARGYLRPHATAGGLAHAMGCASSSCKRYATTPPGFSDTFGVWGRSLAGPDAAGRGARTDVRLTLLAVDCAILGRRGCADTAPAPPRLPVEIIELKTTPGSPPKLPPLPAAGVLDDAATSRPHASWRLNSRRRCAQGPGIALMHRRSRWPHERLRSSADYLKDCRA